MASGTIPKYVDQSDLATGTPIVNKSIGTDSVTCWRSGNMCYANLRTYTTSAIAVAYTTTDTIFTFPSGFRPPYQVDLIGIMSNTQIQSLDDYKLVTFKIMSDGRVQVSSSGNYTQLWVMTVFPVT